MMEKWAKWIIRSTIASIVFWILFKIAGIFGIGGTDVEKELDNSINQQQIQDYVHNANDLINNNGEDLK